MFQSWCPVPVQVRTKIHKDTVKHIVDGVVLPRCSTGTGAPLTLFLSLGKIRADFNASVSRPKLPKQWAEPGSEVLEEAGDKHVGDAALVLGPVAPVLFGAGVVIPESSVNEEDPEIDWVEVADKRAETS